MIDLFQLFLFFFPFWRLLRLYCWKNLLFSWYNIFSCWSWEKWFVSMINCTVGSRTRWVGILKKMYVNIASFTQQTTAGNFLRHQSSIIHTFVNKLRWFRSDSMNEYLFYGCYHDDYNKDCKRFRFAILSFVIYIFKITLSFSLYEAYYCEFLIVTTSLILLTCN